MTCLDAVRSEKCEWRSRPAAEKERRQTGGTSLPVTKGPVFHVNVTEADARPVQAFQPE